MEAAREPLLSRQEVQHRGARQAERGSDLEQLQPVRGRPQARLGEPERRASRRHCRFDHSSIRF